MDSKDYRHEEITKLYEEIAQLRNQQFIIGTIALTGSGLVFGGLHSEVSNLPNTLRVIVLISVVTLSLYILNFLFKWSMMLRKHIVVISEYLKQKGLMEWESWYYLFDNNPDVKKIIGSQTDFVQQAFRLYGGIVSLGALLSILPNNDPVSRIADGLFSNKEVSSFMSNELVFTVILLFILIAFGIYWQVLRQAVCKFKKDQDEISSKVVNYHNVQNEYYLNLTKKKD